jgi:hypothetical protein
MKRPAVAALSLVLAACVHVPAENQCVSFGSVDYCLQPSASRLQLTQLVDLPDAKGGEQVIVYVDVDENAIRMAGLTPFGRRLWQIRADAAGVSSDIPADAALSAPRIVAGLQLGFWPLAQVRPGLRESARLVETANGHVRQLMSAEGTVVFTAICDGERPLCQRAELHYEALGQRLRIQTVEGKAS